MTTEHDTAALSAPPAAATVEGMKLHAQIMNLPCKVPPGYSGTAGWASCYREGHRDARHAAAELVAASPVEAPKAGGPTVEGLMELVRTFGERAYDCGIEFVASGDTTDATEAEHAAFLAIRAYAERLAGGGEQPAPSADLPAIYVVVKDGAVLAAHDGPCHLHGIEGVRYVPATSPAGTGGGEGVPPFAKGSWQHAVDDHLVGYGKTSEEFATPHDAVAWLLAIHGQACIDNTPAAPAAGAPAARHEATLKIELEYDGDDGKPESTTILCHGTNWDMRQLDARLKYLHALERQEDDTSARALLAAQGHQEQQ